MADLELKAKHNSLVAEAKALLPTAAPSLVLIVADDPSLQQRLDGVLTEENASLDIRSDSLWVEVADGLAVLNRVASLASGRTNEVRFAHAPLDATATTLMKLALAAPSLEGLSRTLGSDSSESAVPPSYEVRYQPIVDLRTSNPVGYEALLRATDGKQILAGDEILAQATDSEAQKLDRFARLLAVKGASSWLGEGLLFLNIMAPGGKFDLHGALGTVKLATDAGFAADQLVFETVESNRYQNLGKAAAQLDELRESGVRIALDDVGDGYASLRMISLFKPDIVKISGGIVQELPSQESKAVVKAVVDMAHGMGSWVVAENIEKSSQLNMLGSLGVDWGQGRLLGAPTPARIGAKPRSND